MLKDRNKDRRWQTNILDQFVFSVGFYYVEITFFLANKHLKHDK